VGIPGLTSKWKYKMANTFRVDRNDDQKRVPCGMNSIVYSGDSYRQAKSAFLSTVPGYDAWNNFNPRYGVLFSQWDNDKRDYVVIDSKGF
jgi:hypothetical protein